MQHDDIDNRIGASIRAERESRGWSLTELAARAAVSRAMIHKVERGDSSPTANLLGKLSGAFGLSMSTLLARAEAAGGQLLRRVFGVLLFAFLPFFLFVQPRLDLFLIALVIQLQEARQHLAPGGLADGEAYPLRRFVEAVPQVQVAPAVGGGHGVVHLHV